MASEAEQDIGLGHKSYMRSIQFRFILFLYNFNRKLKISSDKQERQHISQVGN